MTELVVRRFRAWAPRADGTPVESAADWEAWARDPVALGDRGQPEVRFLPEGVRRRATRLTRLMLQAAFDCTQEAERERVRSVFASRHGAIHVAVRILADIGRGLAVSPLQFSHSVHNAQAGLFSIAAGNRQASSSIAAEEDTFGHAFLEAVLQLERAADDPVLLVIGDEPIPANLAHLVDEPKVAYAVALLLARSGAGTPLAFSTQAGRAPRKTRDWPDALEFVRFLATDAPELCLETGRRVWRWQRRVL
jgi:hypothetical protein